MVNYNGEMLRPRDAFERFRQERQDLTIIRADVSVRTDVPCELTKKDYTWTEIERFA